MGLMLAGVATGVATLLAYPTLVSCLARVETVQWNLVLRDVSPQDDHLVRERDGANVFAEEFNDLFLATVNILDFAVMKYARDCRLLTLQEQGHVRLHLDGARAKADELRRFGPLTKVFKLLLLQMRRPFGTACALAIETLASRAFYVLARSPFLKDWESDLTLFHMFEEVEHGPLTVQLLKRDAPFLWRLLALVPMLLVSATFFLFPPISRLIASPMLLVRRPSALWEFVVFYAAFVPAFAVSAWMLLAYFLSPRAIESHASVMATYTYFQERIMARGLTVVDRERVGYPLQVCVSGRFSAGC